METGMNRYIFLIVAFLFFMSACTNRIIFEERVQMQEEKWDKDEPAVFAVLHQDTSQVVDVGMTFKHTDEYAFSNLWVFLEVNGPEGLVQRDTLEMFLAHVDGRWLGEKKSKSYEISALYQHGVKLSKPGNYSFSVIQGMRRNQLEGIQEISFWIQKSKPSEN